MPRRLVIRFLWLIPCLCLALAIPAGAQTRQGAVSIYEEERILSVQYDYQNLPHDKDLSTTYRQQIEDTFQVYPYSHFSWIQTNYFLTKINNYPFVQNADLDIETLPEGGLNLVVKVVLRKKEIEQEKTQNLFRDLNAFPVIYSDEKSLLTFQFSAASMLYGNRNAWFAEPKGLLTGNPLVNGPAGKGGTGWVEGFGSAGIYGVTRLLNEPNLNIYGGLSYLTAFSKGRELFTDETRVHGDVEDAFIGLVGGHKSPDGHDYVYNLTYGRKSFVLGNGWLISNVAMNGQDRAALQLNPRGAARNLFSAGLKIDQFKGQIFQLRPNELPLLDSRTIINGVNVELGSSDKAQLGASVLHVPRSGVKYYRPDGHVFSRKGLWVYNLRLYGNPAPAQPGLFYKTELGYQRNRNFDMNAYAGYLQAGWNFAKTKGSPSLSYRFAYFSGDDPASRHYGRWDALYTGGNGEQWVQGSNMYKIVQNSNEITHMFQLVYTPMRKVQTVTQIWAFIAPQKNNLGGNPGLSTLQSRYYGSEANFTVKYFHSKNGYFHMNVAYTLPGSAIRDALPDARNWLSAMAFVRYSL